MNYKGLYTPSNWGSRYHSLITTEALGAGAAGPGKSLILLWDPMMQVLVEQARCTGNIPDNWDDNLKKLIHKNPLKMGMSEGWALHLRRNMPMLDETIARAHRAFPQIDKDAKWNEKKSWWQFSSGFHYQFAHCEKKTSYNNYLSKQYTHLAFDELVQFNKEQYDQITTRVRSSDPVLKYFLKTRAMSNPKLKGQNEDITVDDPLWVRKYFVDPYPEGNKILRQKVVRRDGSTDYKSWIYLPATLYDNPDPEFVKQYEARLLGKPKHIQDCFLRGRWDTVVGSHFSDEWNPTVHVCKPFRIPEDWPIFRSMDWGFQTHGVIHYYAVGPEGTVYVWYEISFIKKYADIVARELVKPFETRNKLWSDTEGSKVIGPADTQLWEERGDSFKTKADYMAEEGVNWVKADKRDRGANSQRISRRLMDHDNFTKAPGLVIFENCTMLRQTLPSLETDPGDPESPLKCNNDHWYDSLAYGISYAEQSGLVAPKNRRQESLRGYNEDEIYVEQSRGKWGAYGFE